MIKDCNIGELSAGNKISKMRWANNEKLSNDKVLTRWFPPCPNQGYSLKIDAQVLHAV